MYLNREARDHVERTNLDQELTVKEVMGATPEQGGGKSGRDQVYVLALQLTFAEIPHGLPRRLDPGVMARFHDTHDVCMSLIPLVEDPPWFRVSNRTNGPGGLRDNGWRSSRGTMKD